MKRISSFRRLPWAATFVAAVMAAGCATRWQPINGFAEHPSELPLQQAYVFQASPVDRTLKAMLSRWAADSGMKLDYRHASDFTLHRPVAEIRTTRLRDALDRLESAYGSRISMQIAPNAIVVLQPGAGGGVAPPAGKWRPTDQGPHSLQTELP